MKMVVFVFIFSVLLVTDAAMLKAKIGTKIYFKII
jgi:hypothetical protein